MFSRRKDHTFFFNRQTLQVYHSVGAMIIYDYALSAYDLSAPNPHSLLWDTGAGLQTFLCQCCEVCQ